MKDLNGEEVVRNLVHLMQCYRQVVKLVLLLLDSLRLVCQKGRTGLFVTEKSVLEVFMIGEHGLFVVGEANKQKNLTQTHDVRKEELCLFQGFKRPGFR